MRMPAWMRARVFRSQRMLRRILMATVEPALRGGKPWPVSFAAGGGCPRTCRDPRAPHKKTRKKRVRRPGDHADSKVAGSIPLGGPLSDDSQTPAVAVSTRRCICHMAEGLARQFPRKPASPAHASYCRMARGWHRGRLMLLAGLRPTRKPAQQACLLASPLRNCVTLLACSIPKQPP